MSCYTIAASPPYHHCVVGFDPPLGTFFAQIYRAPDARHSPRLVRWLGTESRELPTLTAFTTALAPYAVVPTHLHQCLAHEQASSDSRPHCGTRLQQPLWDTTAQRPGRAVTGRAHVRAKSITFGDRLPVGSGADADGARGNVVGRWRGSS